MTFILASNNENKLAELRRILLPLGLNVISAKEATAGELEVEETGETFEENARLKALAFVEETGLAAIGDDSGLVVDALDGAPGIYSARYAGEGAPNDARIAKLLDNLHDVPEEKRTAKFVSAICCVFPDGREVTVRGECHGRIGFEAVGENGFGYDPVFISESGKTFAQLTSAEKDKISHRGNALRKLRAALEEIL